jgi:hypothetical protein
MKQRTEPEEPLPGEDPITVNAVTGEVLDSRDGEADRRVRGSDADPRPAIHPTGSGEHS